MFKYLMTVLCLISYLGIANAQEEEKTEETDNSKRPSWSAGLPERPKAADLNKPEFKPERGGGIELDMSEFGLQEKPQVAIELPIKSDIAKSADDQDQSPEETPVAAQEVTTDVIKEEPVAAPPETEIPTVEPVAEEVVQELTPAEEQQTDATLLSEEGLDDAAEALESNNEVPFDAEVIEPEQPAVAESQPALIDQPAVETESAVQLETQSDSSESAVVDTASAATDSANVNTEYSWKILQRVPVEYPAKAAIDKLNGWVEVEITIDPAGEVVSAAPINYSRRGRVFSKPAIDSVNQWKFEPPSNAGITSNLTRVYKVEFQL